MFAGFDIGGTNSRLRLYDSDFQEVADLKRRSRGSSEPGEVSALARQMLDELMTDRDPSDLEAVGVGLAGQLSADGETVINAPNLGWQGVDFAALLRETTQQTYPETTVRVVNDLSAALWGEAQRGAARDAEDVLAVYVGTGIGGAILVGGSLVDGAGGKAGEIGHSKVVPGGRLCGCGQRGCVEAYAGGVHLEQQVGSISARLGLDLLDDDEVDLGKADGLVHEVEELDELWRQTTDYLSIVTANACTLLNPAVLLLGGGVLQNLENFRLRTLQKISPLVVEAARDDLDVRFAELGDEAGVLGAAMLAAKS